MMIYTLVIDLTLILSFDCSRPKSPSLNQWYSNKLPGFDSVPSFYFEGKPLGFFGFLQLFEVPLPEQKLENVGQTLL